MPSAALPAQPEVQALATALNVYATTPALGGAAAQAYGFQVTTDGLGADSFYLGNDGAAVGLANNIAMNVYDIFSAMNQRALGGVLYNRDATLRDLCERLNRAGIYRPSLSKEGRIVHPG